jgi:hypothetical protein
MSSVREKKMAAMAAYKGGHDLQPYKTHHEAMELLRGREAGVPVAEAFPHFSRIGRASVLPPPR